MSKDNGGPAFPVVAENGLGHVSDGMTLRDYFAAHALTGAQIWDSVINGREARFANGVHELAEISYAIADAMLAERNKP